MNDESRLPTNLELIEMSSKYRHGDNFDLSGYADEIVAKTASIKDAEYQADRQNIQIAERKKATEQKDAECQQRIEGIFKEIESHRGLIDYNCLLTMCAWWQALKDKYLQRQEDE